MNNLQYQLEARAEVQVLSPGIGKVATDCNAVRIRNEGPDAITLTVNGQAFPLQAGRSWGFETPSADVTIKQVLLVNVPETAEQLVLVERLYLTPWQQ